VATAAASANRSSRAARVRMIEDAIDTHLEAISEGLAEIRFFGRASDDIAKKIEESAAEQVAG